MKIGLIGNMNNNNFALLRYFHDLGVEADLLLMVDDGVGSLAHFAPEADTWDINKLRPFIKSIPASNRFVSALGLSFPWRILFWLKYLALLFLRVKYADLMKPPSRSKIKEVLCGYDYLVGSGITPALLESIDLKLDVFYPYSSGVEWVGDAYMDSYLSAPSFIRRMAARAVRLQQIKGLQRCRRVVTGDIGYTVPVIKKLGIDPLILHAPILYKESSPSSLPVSVEEILMKLERYELRFISHTRHRWVNDGGCDEATWDQKHSKHNDWIVRGYANFRIERPDIRSVLILADYGADAEYTRNLCRELGVNSDVIWIPVMPRNYILEIVNACDVGIGEFYLTPRMTWGGVGWEVMACGKPLIQGFIFDEGEYESLYGISPPPICAARNQDQLNQWMLDLGNSQSLRNKCGDKCINWFNENNGMGLSKRWLKLIVEDHVEI